MDSFVGGWQLAVGGWRENRFEIVLPPTVNRQPTTELRVRRGRLAGDANRSTRWWALL